ncbi:hypothetical protein Lal_00043595 [Lupinus albus]|nr:hypothetical protein Lal_00043595 [Lupinus albus]
MWDYLMRKIWDHKALLVQLWKRNHSNNGMDCTISPIVDLHSVGSISQHVGSDSPNKSISIPHMNSTIPLKFSQKMKLWALLMLKIFSAPTFGMINGKLDESTTFRGCRLMVPGLRILLMSVKQLYFERLRHRPTLQGVQFDKLGSLDKDSLTEIRIAVWDCDSGKSPGPDGYNFKFIKIGRMIYAFGVEILLLSFVTTRERRITFRTIVCVMQLGGDKIGRIAYAFGEEK